MTDPSPTHEVSPRPTSPSASPAEAVPAPPAADEAAPLLISSTEALDDDAPQAPPRSALVHFLTVASLGFSIVTLLIALVTLPIQPYWHYLPWRLFENQKGVAFVMALSLIVSSINTHRLRTRRPLIPLFFNMIFDLAISFYAIALAISSLVDIIDYHECQWGEDRDQCRRSAIPVRIVAGVLMGTALVVGMVHVILFVIRGVDMYRSRFWHRPINFPTGEFTFQFTVKVLKTPQREEQLA